MMCLHMNLKNTWLAISTVFQK